MNITDDQIAAAMELRIGHGHRWKTIGRALGVDHNQLCRAVARAKHRGMRQSGDAVTNSNMAVTHQELCRAMIGGGPNVSDGYGGKIDSARSHEAATKCQM